MDLAEVEMVDTAWSVTHSCHPVTLSKHSLLVKQLYTYAHVHTHTQKVLYVYKYNSMYM